MLDCFDNSIATVAANILVLKDSPIQQFWIELNFTLKCQHLQRGTVYVYMNYQLL